MELQYQHTVDGQEVGQEDLNLVGENSALADDRVLAELLRPCLYDSSTSKGILKPGVSSSPSAPKDWDVVEPSLDAAEVVVRPFKAVIGSRDSSSTIGEKAWHLDIRSAFSATTYLALDPTVGNNRWDLIYARVDIDVDQTAVDRYVKDADGSGSMQSIAVTKATQVSIAVQVGNEGATPDKPAAPADGGGSYYIPLAYVWLAHPFTSSSMVNRETICTVARVLQFSEHVGGSPMAPCNRCYEAGIVFETSWGPSGRPKSYLPPTMAGKVSRILPLSFYSGDPSVPLGATTVVDDSIDWRKRIFKVTAINANASPLGFGWNDAGRVFPSAISGSAKTAMSSSWYTTANPSLFILTDADGLASGSTIDLQVNSSTGNLEVIVSATNPDDAVVFWIEATGRYENAP